MRRCGGCGADAEQDQPHERGCTAAAVEEPDASEVAEMQRRHGTRFSPCACGREQVMAYKRAEVWPNDSASNGADADRLTYHDTPGGVSCRWGGELISKVPGLAATPRPAGPIFAGPSA